MPASIYPLANGLGARFAGLPTVLAGPILRRVEVSQVSVWLATKVPTNLTLQVFATDGTTKLMEGSVSANDGISQINVGVNLTLTCITATPVAGAAALAPGQVYLYNILFPASQDLFSPGILSTAGGATSQNMIAYTAAYQKPSFCLPGSDLPSLRLAHASCRKPHAESLDAYQILDAQLAAHATTPSSRPQQLILTGDQIYADDVADVLLALLTDAGDFLIGQTESLPGFSTPTTPKALMPGQRNDIVDHAGLSVNTGERGNARVGWSHLLSLGEFFAMYLMVFSDVVWPATLPAFTEIFPSSVYPNIFTTKQITPKGSPAQTISDPSFARYQLQSANLNVFKAFLPFVRRALANVATYMLLDDHEVTDDFLMNRAWMNDIFPASGNPGLAPRMIQNALSAYALFQHWGNRPTQLVTNPAWKQLRQSIPVWVQSGFDVSAGADALTKIQQSLALSLPTQKLSTDPSVFDMKADPAVGPLFWSFGVRWSIHELLAIDTRTRRAFPNNETAEAVLITPRFTLATEVDADLAGAAALPSNGITIVIIPSAIVPIPGIESVKILPFPGTVRCALENDKESLFTSASAFEFLLSGLATRTGAPKQMVILSGDVHYGYAASLQYWKLSSFTTASAQLAVAHFISSAAKNQQSDSLASTVRLHNNGFGVIGWEPPPSTVTRLTWSVPQSDENSTFTAVGTVVPNSKVLSAPLRATVDAGYPLSANAPDNTVVRVASIDDVAGFVSKLDKATVTVVPKSVTQATLIASQNGANRNISITPVQTLPSDTLQNRETAVAPAQTNAITAVTKNLSGTQVVGVNNIGVISFDTANAVQELWWWLGDAATLANGILNQLQAGPTQGPLTVPAAQPFSRFTIPLAAQTPPAVTNLKG